MKPKSTDRPPLESAPALWAGARHRARRKVQTQTLRCGVVGVGRMGQHHAAKYNKIPGAKLVGVVDADGDRRELIAEKLNCPSFATVEEMIAHGVDAVSIAVPTVHHLAVAEPLLDAGVACLVEKPLAGDAAEAEKMARLADENGVVLMVGHIERFNPAVRALQRASAEMEAMGQTGIKPRFIEVHRVSPMTFRSVDVSVVMDMMIHDLDVVLMLTGGIEPETVDASGVAVLTDHEDVCSARLKFRLPHGECVVNISASRLAFKTERKTRIIGDNGYVSIDYAKKSGTLIRKTANSIQMEEVREALRQGHDLTTLDYSKLVAIEPLEIDDADQLELELSAFLNCVRTGDRPPIDAQSGFAAVRTAERIIASAKASL